MKANEGACKGEHQKLWGECYQVTWESVHLRVRARSAAQVRCNYSAGQPAHLATHMRSHTVSGRLRAPFHAGCRGDSESAPRLFRCDPVQCIVLLLPGS